MRARRPRRCKATLEPIRSESMVFVSNLLPKSPACLLISLINQSCGVSPASASPTGSCRPLHTRVYGVAREQVRLAPCATDPLLPAKCSSNST
jgi:hypothetical protein